MRDRLDAGIYGTHGKEQLFGMKAVVDGVLSLAYVKNGKLISYEPWEDINRKMYSMQPCLVFTTMPVDHCCEQ